jgi:hypothetical protein
MPEDLARSYADSLAGCTAEEAARLTEEMRYVSLLYTHDWRWMHRGSIEAVRQGLRDTETLLRLRAKLDHDFALWNQHVPEAERFGVVNWSTV